MANFPPLKNYLLYCLDRLIDSFNIQGPFLDVGCGIGDVSVHFARKGWKGIALDNSEKAFEAAKKNLLSFNSVKVQRMSFFEFEGSFKTVLAMDVIEHIPNDIEAIDKLASLLDSKGYLVLSVPMNPKEWRWDDDFYGHVRRYSKSGISEKLLSCGLEVVDIFDFTFPVFWLMRRMYTRLKKPAKTTYDDSSNRTKESSLVNAWTVPLISDILSIDFLIWRLIFKVQYSGFRRMIDRGHEAIVLARKQPANKT